MIFLGGFRLVFPRRPWRGKPRTRNTTFCELFHEELKRRKEKNNKQE